MKLSRSLLIPSALIAFATASSSQDNESLTSCYSVPHWQGPFKTGSLAIGTYHITGEPGSERLIEATWPRSDLSPFPDVQRDDGASETLIFYFDPMPLDLDNPYGTSILPKIALTLRGVDKFPLYSSMARIAGGPIGELLRHPDGSTYRSSEGYIIAEEQELEGWVQYAYPNALQPSNGRDSWFQGTPDVDGIELLLECRNNPSGEYQSCSITGKSEPIRYTARFDAVDLDQIRAIDAFANDFVSCMLEEN